MFRLVRTATTGLAAALALVQPSIADAQDLVILDQFDPAETGQLIGTGFDVKTDRIWLYGGGASIFSYTFDGTPIGSVARPGEAANDADVDFTAVDILLNGTPVPAGSLLFINGETGPAEIYAMDPSDGTVITTLMAQFGASHVVGGAFSQQRNSLFLVADRFDANPSTIAEISLSTGAVLQSFPVGYVVNFGDIAIDPATGNILVVSSFEASIRELSSTGAFVRDIPLPVGVSSLSGIAADKLRGDLLLGGTGGTLWRVRNVANRLPVPLPSGAAAGDRFGDAVGTDGNLYAIGRPGANEVIVFRVEGDTLIEDAVIPVPANRSASNFGAALVLEGDRLLIGAPADGVAAKGNPLSAALFQRLAGGWTMKQDFSSGATGDDFGASLAMEGEVLIIGAPGDDADGADAGAAHVFVLDDDDGQLFTQRLPPPTTAGGKFGRSVAVSGGSAAVGAPDGGTGTVSLFANVSGNLSSLSSVGTMPGSQSATGDGFGTSVAIDGNTMAVGSPGEDGDSGAVYLFDPSNLTERSRLEPIQPQSGAGFGRSVALANGQMAVGAPGFDGSGAVFRFAPNLTRIQTLFAPTGAQGFGASVAISGSGLVAGAPDSDNQLGAALASRDEGLVLRSGFE